MENNSENSEKKDESSSNEGREKMKVWLQENLRMLVSIVIVVVIAGGIYAYSKRTQAPMNNNEPAVSEESGEGKISVIGGDTANEENNEAANNEEQTAPQAEEMQKPAETTQQNEAVTAPASQETGSSFVETAAPGDGTTKLARRALANYLEKNPDTSLTAEHKIYIEDYLRRQVPNGKLAIGATREFSKGMIANAIEKSKNLNEKQLQNLQKYANAVPGLN
ncbi:MAG: hypothetical protein WC831_01010 [Parcubacteria group bacterium]